MSAYSQPQGHRSMVFDDVRNTYYAEAIKKAVNERSTVLDLGAGLGLHGLMAAQAGARKVYLVEPAPILEVTRQLVSENNLHEQVECISERIEEVDLPGKVDVIVSVFTGNFLLTEDLLPSLFFARDKFLAPGGKLIPDRAVMEVVPVSAAAYYAKHIDCWNTGSQGVAYNRVRDYAANTLFYDGADNLKTSFLSKPAELMEMDFMTATEACCRSRIEVKVEEDGLCHGWLGWFRTRLGDQWLSTSPLEKETHWSQVFLPLAKPILVKRGQILGFELDRPEFGEWSWVVEHENKKQRHSTFLSEPISLSTMQKKSDNHKPRISDKGLVALEVLSRFKGKASTADIINYVATEHTKLFPTHKIADQFVKKLVEKHGI